MAKKPSASAVKRQKDYEALFIKFHAGNEAWARGRIETGVMTYDAQSAEYMTRVIADREAFERRQKDLAAQVAAEKQADKDAVNGKA